MDRVPCEGVIGVLPFILHRHLVTVPGTRDAWVVTWTSPSPAASPEGRCSATDSDNGLQRSVRRMPIAQSQPAGEAGLQEEAVMSLCTPNPKMQIQQIGKDHLLEQRILAHPS